MGMEWIGAGGCQPCGGTRHGRDPFLIIGQGGEGAYLYGAPDELRAFAVRVVDEVVALVGIEAAGAVELEQFARRLLAEALQDQDARPPVPCGHCGAGPREACAFDCFTQGGASS